MNHRVNRTLRLCRHLFHYSLTMLSVFGYAASDALRAEGSLNAGLLDQRLGLEWIKENIEYFGGDPDNITIFGESEGALTVGLHALAYGGQNQAPFNKAVMQSGGPTGNFGITGNISAVHSQAIAQRTNCTSSNTTSVETLACLRNIPMQQLLDVVIQYEAEVNPLGLHVL
ncbi:hypothetical protein VTN77DRAFT_5247 [Rasamsonia byssochlamydoides]|uniref:uncharacterized protein n=1 Tax=Rasamsonia byssochlamydoides TaxID=89139 RepID=UPI003743FAA4